MKLLCILILLIAPMLYAEAAEVAATLDTVAPNDVCADLWQTYTEEVQEIIQETTADIEKERSKLVETLKREQSRSGTTTADGQQGPYQDFISYFQADTKTTTDLFGNTTQITPQKQDRLPDISQLPTNDSKRIEQYTLKVTYLIDSAIAEDEKEKKALLKKLAYQIKKTTRAKDLDIAVKIQTFLELIEIQTPVKDALSDLLPQKTYPNCELYLSMDLNSVSKSDKGMQLLDHSSHAQIIPVPQALKFDKGHRQEALRFDEQHSLTLKMPESLSKSTSITLCAWIYIENIPEKSQRTIISHTHPNWEMQIENGSLLVEGAGSPSSTTQFKNDTWYHVAWIFDDELKQQCIYVNGLKEAEINARNPLQSDPSQSIVIGNRSGGNCGPWLGLIDEVYIFSRAITDEELAELSKP